MEFHGGQGRTKRKDLRSRVHFRGPPLDFLFLSSPPIIPFSFSLASLNFHQNSLRIILPKVVVKENWLREPAPHAKGDGEAKKALWPRALRKEQVPLPEFKAHNGFGALGL